MKQRGLLSLALVLALLFTACGAQSEKFTSAEMAPSADTLYNYSYAEDEVGDAAENGFSFGSVSDKGVPSQTVRAEKLVYTADITLETEDFDNASDTLHQSIAAAGGFIQNENANNLNGVNRRGARSLRITARIPTERYEDFIAGLSESYNVVSVNRNVDNLTTQYYDNETRLAAYRVQEERLIEMLGQANTVAEMLEIESRLSDVQYCIESLTNTQRTIDNDVQYSTFYLSLSEVTKFTTPEPITFGERIADAVKTSAESFGEFCQSLLVGLVYALPYLLVLLVAVVIAVLVLKSKRKKKAKASAKANENSPEN